MLFWLLWLKSSPLHVADWPVVMAWLEEMQACVTVWAGVWREKPAPRAAWNHNREHTVTGQLIQGTAVNEANLGLWASSH